MTLSRFATVGPFEGAVLSPAPLAFNDPANLARWDDGPRVTACFSELVEGLAITTPVRQERAVLGFTDLHASSLRTRQLVSLRGPDLAILHQQIELVAAYADLRGDRGAEIVAQITPPTAFWASVVGLQAPRHKKTLQLMDLAFGLAVHVEMPLKQIFAVARPVELSPQIQPMIPTPGHAAWPSGHATEAFIVAHLLEQLLHAARPGKPQRKGLNDLRGQLQRLAYRIAVNRTVAGLHYPVDSAVGRLLGTALGEFLVARCSGARLRERGFDARRFTGPHGETMDFSLVVPLDSGAGSITGSPFAVSASPMLAWLWKEAVKEWA